MVKPIQVHAGAEGAPRPGHNHGANGVVLARRSEGRDQLVGISMVKAFNRSGRLRVTVRTRSVRSQLMV
jgi:hypothetical protein